MSGQAEREAEREAEHEAPHEAAGYWAQLRGEQNAVQLNMCARADASPRRRLEIGSGALALQQRYAAANDSFVGDLVELVMSGEGTGGFYWKSTQQSTGMLDSIRALLEQKYGRENVQEHVALVGSIERHGTPQQWALLWLLCLPFDRGLQRYVCGLDDDGSRPPPGQRSSVEQYVGTDGVCKHASDYAGLRNYLRGVVAASKDYLYQGMTAPDRARLYLALKRWHVYGGRAH
jgi:hypothetical protein